MRVEYDIKLGFKDVMFRPKRSKLCSRSLVSLEREFKLLNCESSWEGIPIMAANMDTVGTFEMALALYKSKVFTAIHKHYSIGEWLTFIDNAPEDIGNYIAVSTGTGSEDVKKLEEIFSTFPQLKWICIDVANGYSECFVEFVIKIRSLYPDKVIIAGHEESGGETIKRNGKKIKKFYGMSSLTAMDKYVGGVSDYRASEGKTVEVPYRGGVESTIKDILGGVRSTCTYVGAKSLKELTKRTTFIRVNEQENGVYMDQTD